MTGTVQFGNPAEGLLSPASSWETTAGVVGIDAYGNPVDAATPTGPAITMNSIRFVPLPLQDWKRTSPWETISSSFGGVPIGSVRPQVGQFSHYSLHGGPPGGGRIGSAYEQYSTMCSEGASMFSVRKNGDVVLRGDVAPLGSGAFEFCVEATDSELESGGLESLTNGAIPEPSSVFKVAVNVQCNVAITQQTIGTDGVVS